MEWKVFKNYPRVSRRNRGPSNSLQAAVVPGTRRYSGHEVDPPATGELRRPEAESKAALFSALFGSFEFVRGGAWIALGAGRRRNAYLARSYFEDLPNSVLGQVGALATCVRLVRNHPVLCSWSMVEREYQSENQ